MKRSLTPGEWAAMTANAPPFAAIFSTEDSSIEYYADADRHWLVTYTPESITLDDDLPPDAIARIDALL